MSEVPTSLEFGGSSPEVVLDLFGMTDEQWQTAALVSGGSSCERVSPADDYDPHFVSHVVFMWGDPDVPEHFERLTQAHQETEEFIAFNASAILGGRVWMLVPQAADFDPLEFELENIGNPRLPNEGLEQTFIEVPYSYPKAEKLIQDLLDKNQFPLPFLATKINGRYFSLATAVNGFEFTDRHQLTHKLNEMLAKNRVLLRQDLLNKYDEWNFSDHDQDQNTEFAFQYAQLVMNAFEYQQKLLHGSNEFSADQLHPALRPLATFIYQGKQYPHERIQVRVSPRGEDEVVASQWPEFQELMNQGLTFEQIKDQLASSPEALKHYQPERRYKDEAVVIELFDNHVYSQSWGLRFVVKQGDITVQVFGNAGYTESASQFMLTYHDKPRVLAEVVSNLAMLCAKHADNY